MAEVGRFVQLMGNRRLKKNRKLQKENLELCRRIGIDARPTPKGRSFDFKAVDDYYGVDGVNATKLHDSVSSDGRFSITHGVVDEFLEEQCLSVVYMNEFIL